MAYGVIQDASCKLAFRAKIPLPEKGQYETRRFTRRNSDNPKQAAIDWVNQRGIEVWGYRRWLLVKAGKLTRLRSESHSVTIYTATSRTTLADGSIAEYPVLMVRWRDDDGNERTKAFSQKRYGEQARHEALIFAARKRAELTGGELHLPSDPEFFDVA